MPATIEYNAVQNPCHVVAPGEGESYWTIGDLVTFKVGPQQTGGVFSLAEAELRPGGGPPPHVHAREDETFYVLAGRLQFLLEDDLFDAVPGDALFLPRGKVHQFRLMTDTPARVLVMATPCGFETFIPEFAPRVKPGETAHPPTQDQIDKLLIACAKYGIELRPDHKPRNAPKPARSTKRSLWALGNRVDLKLTSEDTGGAFMLCTLTSAPGGGAPTHLHKNEEEMFFVESGTYEFLLGDRTITARPGTTIFVPRGTMHGFKNTADAPGRLASFHFPGGFEDFFIEAGTDCTDPDSPAPIPTLDVPEMCRKHGMELAS